MAFPYSKQTWTDGVSSASAARLAVIEDGIAMAGVFGTSSSPPGSPVDGMIWRLPASSSTGVYWFFQYDSSQATYKWVFMGGPPLTSEVATSETSNSATYVDLATVGPSITLPRGGDYIVSHGNSCFNAVGAKQYQTVKLGAAAAADAHACIHDAVNLTDTPSKTFRSNGASASDVYKLMYRNNVTNTGTWLERWISVTPVRVI